MTKIVRSIAALCILALAAPALSADEAVSAQASATSSLVATSGTVEHAQAPRFCFITYATNEAVAEFGGLAWYEDHCNTVLTGGKNDLLDKYFKGSSYTAAWYLALKHTGTIAAADVWTSHAGWTEATPYSGNRPGITFGTTSAGSNTATAVSISINATDADVKGACVSAVNTGTSGVLYSCSDFSGARSVLSGDTLSVTLTVTD